MRGISATNIVPAYVATSNGRDEQLFLANEGQDWEESQAALLRVLRKASAPASLGMHDIIWGTETVCRFWLVRSLLRRLAGGQPARLCVTGGECEFLIYAFVMPRPREGWRLALASGLKIKPQT